MLVIFVGKDDELAVGGVIEGILDRDRSEKDPAVSIPLPALGK